MNIFLLIIQYLYSDYCNDSAIACLIPEYLLCTARQIDGRNWWKRCPSHGSVLGKWENPCHTARQYAGQPTCSESCVFRQPLTVPVFQFHHQCNRDKYNTDITEPLGISTKGDTKPSVWELASKAHSMIRHMVRWDSPRKQKRHASTWGVKWRRRAAASINWTGGSFRFWEKRLRCYYFEHKT